MSRRRGSARAIRIDVVRDEHQAGLAVGRQIADLVETNPRPFVLGCPAGRTPRLTYAAFAALAGDRGLDLSRLEIVMMDDYVECRSTGYALCPPDALHSCRRFAEHELRRVLNARLPVERRVRPEAIHFPDPQAVDRYEDLIIELGGIDLFLLAAGSSDGHVAFNPPGSTIDSTTRIVHLPESTRHDNLATFPTLGSLERVPRFGVTVGLGTIVRHASRVTLLLPGAEKRVAFSRTVGTAAFDPGCPATLVHGCRSARIVADRAAASRVETVE